MGKYDYHSHKYECGCEMSHYGPSCPLPYKIDRLCGEHEQFGLFGDFSDARERDEALSKLYGKATDGDG